MNNPFRFVFFRSGYLIRKTTNDICFCFDCFLSFSSVFDLVGPCFLSFSSSVFGLVGSVRYRYRSYSCDSDFINFRKVTSTGYLTNGSIIIFGGWTLLQHHACHHILITLLLFLLLHLWRCSGVFGRRRSYSIRNRSFCGRSGRLGC